MTHDTIDEHQLNPIVKYLHFIWTQRLSGEGIHIAATRVDVESAFSDFDFMLPHIMHVSDVRKWRKSESAVARFTFSRDDEPTHHYLTILDGKFYAEESRVRRHLLGRRPNYLNTDLPDSPAYEYLALRCTYDAYVGGSGRPLRRSEEIVDDATSNGSGNEG